MTQHDNILIVPVPGVAFGFDVNNYAKSSELMFMIDMEEVAPEYDGIKDESLVTKNLPPGPWRIVGRAKELTEELWKEVVPELNAVAGRWPNYCGGHPFFSTATESGLSLLRSYGIDPETNPLILKKEGV